MDKLIFELIIPVKLIYNIGESLGYEVGVNKLNLVDTFNDISDRYDINIYINTDNSDYVIESILDMAIQINNKKISLLTPSIDGLYNIFGGDNSDN